MNRRIRLAPATADPDTTISATVRALVGARRLDTAEVAKKLGISRSSLYSRLNGDVPWLAREVTRAAEYLGCDITDLYSGQITVRRAS